MSPPYPESGWRILGYLSLLIAGSNLFFVLPLRRFRGRSIKGPVIAAAVCIVVGAGFFAIKLWTDDYFNAHPPESRPPAHQNAAHVTP